MPEEDGFYWALLDDGTGPLWCVVDLLTLPAGVCPPARCVFWGRDEVESIGLRVVRWGERLSAPGPSRNHPPGRDRP